MLPVPPVLKFPGPGAAPPPPPEPPEPPVMAAGPGKGASP